MIQAVVSFGRFTHCSNRCSHVAGGHTVPSAEWLNLVQTDSEVPGRQKLVGCIRKIVFNCGQYELQREKEVDTSVDWPKFPPAFLYNPHMLYSQFIQNSSEPHSFTLTTEVVCP